MEKLSEAELVGKVVGGDTEAEAYFFKIHRPRLQRACAYLLGPHASDAEDVVQDTFIVALPKLKHYVFHAPIYAWLRQISIRLCYAKLRERGRMVATLESSLELQLRRVAWERQQDTGEKAMEEQKLSVLNALVRGLSPTGRRIIQLRITQGMSYAQISRSLDIPLGTVMSRISRAKGQLRRMLESRELPFNTRA